MTFAPKLWQQLVEQHHLSGGVDETLLQAQGPQLLLVRLCVRVVGILVIKTGGRHTHVSHAVVVKIVVKIVIPNTGGINRK